MLGIYALQAEWRALLDPATERSVAQVKLLWWRDEMRRLAAGTPLHPISRHLADLPNAADAGLAGLDAALEAAAIEASGVPLERAIELDSHAAALYGVPILVASRLANPQLNLAATIESTKNLAVAHYLARALTEYRRDAQHGRVPLPVDSLIAGQIDNEDLCAAIPPAHLQIYLDELRRQAENRFAASARAVSPPDRPSLRHLAVLAGLGARHVTRRMNPAGADFRPADLYNAWNAARRATAGRS